MPIRGIDRWPRRLGVACVPVLWLGVPVTVPAEESDSLDTIDVVAPTPVHGVGLPKDKIPYPVQGATASEIADSISADLPQFMNERSGQRLHQ